MGDNFVSKSFLAGTFGGLCGVSLSHPFDTLRVRIQTEGAFKYRGIKDLYKGIGPPLFGVMMEKTIVFGSYNVAYQYLKKKRPEAEKEMTNHFVAGVFSGAACTSIVTPLERIKINLQNTKSEYRNTLDFLRKSSLDVRSLYRGWTSTLTREMPGYGIYFWTYESLRKRVDTQKNMALKSFLMGGFSGAFAWLFIYPSDVVKSRLQMEGNQYRGLIDCVKQSVKNEGIGVFYRGFYTALLRAVPLHAGVFMGYELFMRM